MMGSSDESTEWNISIAEMRQAMEAGERTSQELVEDYLARIDSIDAHGPRLNSVLEINPDAMMNATQLDAERADGMVRGPLHGIPILLKDNLDIAGPMHTTAGSLALMGSRPARDATVVARLKQAGAVILGKTNMSEWANFRSEHSSSGWSGRGGQTRNPYALDRTPSGSSSGSAVAVAAGLCAAAIGTETDGSIVSPSSMCGVVGIKPTVGLTSRAGVIPISGEQDTIGVHARTVEDGAAVLSAIVGADDRDEKTASSDGMFPVDYVPKLSADALKGTRLGIPRNARFTGYSPGADDLFDASVQVLSALGAEIVDSADIPTIESLNDKPGEGERLRYEFKRDLNAYLAERGDPEVETLADLIAFNREHADLEMPYFPQDVLEEAEAYDVEGDREKMDALSERLRRQAGPGGIDVVLKDHQLDALIAPSGAPAAVLDPVNGEKHPGGSTSVSAMAGYPIVTVPMGMVYGLPVGLSFMGTAFSEATLLALAYAFEQATMMRRVPTFRPESVDARHASLGIERPVVPGMDVAADG